VYKRQEYFSITGSRPENISGLVSLHDLKALTISGADAGLVSALIEKSPGLQYLNIDKCNVHDLHGFKGLESLEGIVLGTEAYTIDLDPLKSLDRLRYIGFNKGDLSNDKTKEFFRRVEQVCPQCIGYLGGGFCLGSGWLLLALPLLFALFFMKRRTHRQAVISVPCDAA
jgi:hypothetical protein